MKYINLCAFSLVLCAAMAYGGGYYFQKPELTDVPDNARVLVYDASSNTDKNFTGAFLKGYFARSGHNHVFSNISGLQSALDSKSEVGHGHTIPYITGLQAILDGKVDLTDHRLTDARAPASPPRGSRCRTPRRQAPSPGWRPWQPLAITAP